MGWSYEFFVYHLLTLNSLLQTSPSNKYETILEDEYMEKHLVKAVNSSRYTKNQLAVPHSWRLPACIDCLRIETELDCVVVGCWATLGAGAVLLYFIQRYMFMGKGHTSIFLFAGTTGLNLMTKPHHQLNAEMMSIGLGRKKTQIEIEMLKAFIVSPTLCLISNSQTLLRLCCKPAMTVPMEIGLLVHRVHLGRVAVVAGAAGANKGLLRKDKKKKNNPPPEGRVGENSRLHQVKALMSIPDVPC